MARNTMTEEELAAAGIMVGPDGKAVILKDKETPDESWSLTQLGMYIRKTEQTALAFSKAEAVERYYQGHAVHLAHEKCKANGTKWKEWCERNRINRMRAWRSERLYLFAGKVCGEEAVKEVSKHSITALYLKFGIVKNPDRFRNRGDQGNQPPAQDSPEPANNGDSAHASHCKTRTPADHADRRDQRRSTIRLITEDEDNDGERDSEEEVPATDKEEDTAGHDSEIEEHDEQRVVRRFDFTERVGRVASVTHLEPGKFLLEVSDDSIVFKLTVDRAMLETVHDDSEQEMEEDDACEPIE